MRRFAIRRLHAPLQPSSLSWNNGAPPIYDVAKIVVSKHCLPDSYGPVGKKREQVKTILFCMHQELGHINPTFKIGRALLQKGFNVRYFATPDIGPNIAAQGFTPVAWFPDLFPSGYAEAETKMPRFAKRRLMTRLYQEMAERMLSQQAEAREIIEADLVVVDINEPLIAMLAKKHNVPCVMFNTALPQTEDPGIPPTRSLVEYGPGWLNRARAALLWWKFRIQRRATAWLANRIGLCPPYALVMQLAPRFGIRASELESNTMYMPQLRNTHELLACPAAFDFPRPQSACRSYIESIDLHRKEVSFPWGDLDPSKPLIYCSFGTQSYQRDNVAQLLGCLVSVAQLRPNFQFVIATGAQAGLVTPSSNAANIVIVQRAPQLALLSRAEVMITHAGLGSIKECLAFGVPMLAFPLAIDQPGNAARIKHHGLGIVGNVRRVSAARLVLMLEQLIGDPSFKDKAERMRREFERVENASTGVTLIEALLTGDARQPR